MSPSRDQAVEPLIQRHFAMTRPLLRTPPLMSNLHFSEQRIARMRRDRLHSLGGADQMRKYERFQLVSQWDCHVVHVGDGEFTALVLRPDGQGGRRRDHARMPTRLIRQQDRDLLAEGAPFYYCIGRFFSKGQSASGSVVWFRRLVESREPIEDAIRRGEAWMGRLGWEE
jgi:hypothetical protein